MQVGARLSHVSTCRPKLGGETGPPPAAKGSGGEEGSAGKEGEEELLCKSEARAVWICCSMKSGIKKEPVQNWRKAFPCNKHAIQI